MSFEKHLQISSAVSRINHKIINIDVFFTQIIINVLCYGIYRH
ncbi:hypothetical protein ECDEC10F_6129 [Escherichia coli DEC10F]|nr:hypothetical protein ECDEC10F_6129 [Escherichia coli DEC10F]